MADQKQLTPEQEALLQKLSDEWLAHGLSTEPANRPAAEEGVRKAYTLAGRPIPQHFIWVDSPAAGAIALGIMPHAIDAARAMVDAGIKDLVGKGKLDKTRTLPQLKVNEEDMHKFWRNTTYGQHSAGYYLYLDAMQQVGGRDLSAVEGAFQVAKNAGWWWPAEEFVIITERPKEIHRDAQRRLHNETGPAVLYRDGWGVCVWHGTKVPRSLVEGKWTAKEILAEENTEVRRCAIEKMGWDRFAVEGRLKKVGKSVQDPGNPGEELHLFDIPEDLFGDRNIRLLVCTNATIERDGTRRKFGLTVPREITNPIAAAAWTFGMSEKEYQELQRAC